MGYQFEVVVPNVEEKRAAAESPAQYVERLSRDKALAGAALVAAEAVVIGSDTIVVKINRCWKSRVILLMQNACYSNFPVANTK